ncbi:MAG: hypothetical protein ACOX5Z_00185 [Desulfobulbus sp.]|jgi:hypothetical protein
MTEHEQVRADFEGELARTGVDITWEGRTVRCFHRAAPVVPDSYHNQSVQRRQYWFAHGAVPVSPPGTEVDIDGTLWVVVESCRQLHSDTLTVSRYLA